MKKPTFNLEGKIAAITGAAGVLCSNMAFALAEAGVKVALLDLNVAKAKELAAEINKSGGKAVGVECNVLKKDSIEAALATVLAEYGDVDILINGAGGNHPKATANDQMSFFDIPEDALKFVFDLNCMGTLIPSQVFGAHFMKVNKGNILNISSMGAIRPLTRVVAYSAAKAAVSNITQWLATYFAKNGAPNVRVNAIAPGPIMTERARQRGAQANEHVASMIPLGHLGEPDDIAGGMEYLLKARFVHGQTLSINGGMYMP